MKYILLIILGLAAALVQSIWAYFFSLENTVLNLTLFFSLYYISRSKYTSALIFSFFAGLFLDFLSSQAFGIQLIALLCTTFILNIFYKFFPWQKLIFKILFMVLAIILNYFMLTLTNYLINKNLIISIHSLSWAIVYNFLGAFITLYLLKYFNNQKSSNLTLVNQ